MFPDRPTRYDGKFRIAGCWMGSTVRISQQTVSIRKSLGRGSVEMTYERLRKWVAGGFVLGLALFSPVARRRGDKANSKTSSKAPEAKEAETDGKETAVALTTAAKEKSSTPSPKLPGKKQAKGTGNIELKDDPDIVFVEDTKMPTCRTPASAA